MPDTWYHVAATVKSNYEISIFINGHNDGGEYSGTADSIAYNSMGVGVIGKVDGSKDEGGEHYFHGKIDELVIYDHAFSDEQILSHYQETNGSTDIILLNQSTNSIPDKPILLQNHPNPFNPTTTIKYQIPRAGHVTLTIFDISGREVIRLVDIDQRAGFHSVLWDARNQMGQPVTSGIYFYQLKSGEHTQTKRMILMH